MEEFNNVPGDFFVEFDGPQHDSDPKQIRRDEYKNRFCKDAGFNLTRITDKQLEEHEKVSLLAYILERYISWQKEYPKIMAEINERFNEIATDDSLIVEMRESGILDPSFDPSFIFDIRHPFPSILTITHRLLRKQIFTLRSNRQMNEYLKRENPSFIYSCEVPPSSGGSSIPSNRWAYSAKEVVSEPPGLVEVIHTVEKTGKLKWGCSVGRTFGNIPAFGEMHDIFLCDLPGVHIPDIAEQLAEYLCLREIERWAEINLSI